VTSHPFGKTGLLVSRIGLGLAALGRPGYINVGHGDDLGHHYDVVAMEARCHAVLDAAWNSGIRYFDAARSYGKAELFLASWLKSRQIDPKDIVVGSKWGYAYTADWRVDAEKHELKEHSVRQLVTQYAESRAILGGYLNLYQIHSATLESGILENREVIQELLRLKQTGLKIGLSVSGPRQAETIRRAIAVGVFDCVQATWNLLERSAGEALNEAHEVGMGVIVKESLANGRLMARDDDPAFAAKRRVLEAEAQRLDCSLDALAMAAVLAQPWANVVLSGAATGDQMRSNVRAIDVNWNGEIDGIEESPEVYWETRASLKWN
jgi:aryl-alcohol dehydrogenase-like predicted oxidoreductase